jgi:hypothetical protein
VYGEVLEVDQSVVIGIDSGMAIRRIVVLIVKRHLDQAIERSFATLRMTKWRVQNEKRMQQVSKR